MRPCVRLLSRILENASRRSKLATDMNADLTAIFAAAVTALQPENLIAPLVAYRDRVLSVSGKPYPLTQPAVLVGFGKAVRGMALEVERLLGDGFAGGIVSIPQGLPPPSTSRQRRTKLRFIEGAADNLPDARALGAAQEIKMLAVSLTKEDLLIVVISGGGSALLPFPKDPMTLDQKLNLIKLLGNKGATIGELNTVRKKLSDLKGGGLAKYAAPAKVISLILSDVIGDDLGVIASGPTVQNDDNPYAALDVVKKYELYDGVSRTVQRILETDDSFQINNADNYLVGSNCLAVEAAKRKAESLDYEAKILSTKIQGNVETVATFYSKLAKLLLRPIPHKLKQLLEEGSQLMGFDDIDIEDISTIDYSRNMCIIASGEPTVVVSGSGKGGRNQELALRFSLKLREYGVEKDRVFFLSAGTDGADGPTDAAGALSIPNIDVEEAQISLSNNDSYGFLKKVDGGKWLVKTGMTGTNVMDVHVIVVKGVPRRARSFVA